MQQFTLPYTPQQNHVVERKNMTLGECARSMIKGKNLSNSLWAETISVIYLKNIIPTRFLDFKTPFEALYGFKPTTHQLMIFGSKAFTKVLKENIKKIDARDIKCIFVGYCTKFKTYKMFDPHTHRVFASRDVVFDELEDEGNEDNNYETWHILHEVEDNKLEAKAENNEQQKHGEESSDVDIKSLIRNGEVISKNKGESSEAPNKST